MVVAVANVVWGRADGMSGIFWLFLNKGRYTESWRKMFLTGANLIIFGIGGCLVCRLLFRYVVMHSPILTVALQCGLGLYVSGKSIHDNPSSASFSCADNSG